MMNQRYRSIWMKTVFQKQVELEYVAGSFGFKHLMDSFQENPDLPIPDLSSLKMNLLHMFAFSVYCSPDAPSGA